MGVPVLILGRSGSGKSTSLRNFKPDEVVVFNVAGKPLPFRGKLPTAQRPDYAAIVHSLQANKHKCYVIDDANYLMAFQSFALANQKGYDKFTHMAVDFESLLEAALSTDADTTVYFLMHPEADESGYLKPKTIGKMLDNQLCIEGLFSVVLIAGRDNTGYYFRTQTSGNDPAKSPLGMFDGERIDNDLRAVDDTLRAYWGLSGRKAKAKAANSEPTDKDLRAVDDAQRAYQAKKATTSKKER